MSLICGDIHGNYNKAKAFLEYRPDKEHVFVGDYTDSFHATNEQIMETMKMIFESNSIVLVGNHDLQYFTNASLQLKCSGFRPEAYGFIHLMEMYKDRIQASYVVDDYLITHAGVSKGMSDYMGNLPIEEISKWFNYVFDQWKNAVVISETLNPIFNISRSRGGSDKFSGPFWADYRYEEYEERFNQIFGHSYSSSPKDIQTKEFTELVCVDCPQYLCYNTETKNFEDFFPKEMINDRWQMEINF